METDPEGRAFFEALLEAPEDECLARFQPRFAHYTHPGVGWNCLMLAASRFSLTLVKRLIEAGTDVNYVSIQNRGETALLFAAERWQSLSLETVELLLSYGANPMYACKYGRNCLMEALDAARTAFTHQQRHNIEPNEHDCSVRKFEVLVRAGADLLHRDRHGESVLKMLRRVLPEKYCPLFRTWWTRAANCQIAVRCLERICRVHRPGLASRDVLGLVVKALWKTRCEEEWEF